MKKITKALGPWGPRLFIIIVIMVVMAILQPRFFKASNASNILQAIAVIGIMACGMIFPILSGGIDLCIGSTAGLVSCIVLMNVVSKGDPRGFIIGLAIGLLVAIAVGIFHGVVVTSFKIPAFIATLATQYVVRGIAMVITGNQKIYPTGNIGWFVALGNSGVAGIPLSIIFLFGAVIIVWFILKRTVFGKKFYAVGGNAAAARLAGIPVNRYIIIGYAICSFFCGFAGVLLASYGGMAFPSTGGGYEGNVIMAMVIGGISLAGGEGTVIGALYGAILVGIIQNVMNLLSLDSNYHNLIKGIIIVLALIFTEYMRSRKSGLSKVKVRLR